MFSSISQSERTIFLILLFICRFTIKIWVSNQHAPYVETKPLHQSQEILERQPNGILIQLKVQYNFELEREILGFGDGMVVLEPQKLREIIKKRLDKAVGAYL